jgi:hypothetical protein
VENFRIRQRKAQGAIKLPFPARRLSFACATPPNTHRAGAGPRRFSAPMSARPGSKQRPARWRGVWHEQKKVLNIEWDDQGGFEVLSYKPGEWEWLL